MLLHINAYGYRLTRDAMSENAKECNGDTVATIHRKLEKVLAAMDSSAASDETRIVLLAVQQHHMPSLLDAFEADTNRAD